MTNGARTEGPSVLLRFSFVADRGGRALKHFLDRNGVLSHEDLTAIGKAREFLDFTFAAQQLATGQVFQGFSPDKMKVRDAAYAAASTAKPTKEERFAFTQYLERIRSVLDRLQVHETPPRRDIEEASSFLTRVRDHFQGRSSLPIEVVNRPHEVVF